MVLICNICCEPYTGPGTEHAIYSTICGHLIGKSCLEKWRNSRAAKAFTCPRCNRKLSKKDYHPIYDLPDDFFDDIKGEETSGKCINDGDIINEYLKSNLTMDVRFIKRVEQEFGGQTRLADVHNGYLLLVGYASPRTLEGQFLKIIDCRNGHTYNTINVGNILCTAVAFNKFQTDMIEFMAGFNDGNLWRITILHDSTNRTIYKECEETSPINSICFLGREKYAYSVGSGCVYVSSTVNNQQKDNWYRIDTESNEIVSNLERISDGAIIGLTKGKIYVFEEYGESYTLCADSGNVIEYTIDHTNSMILVFYSKKNKFGEYSNTTQSYVLRRIMQTFCRPNTDSTKQGYSAFTRKMVSNKDGKFPVPFLSNLVVKSNDEDKFYECSVIPNIKTQTLDVIHITTTPKVIGKEGFENINDCLGVKFISEPEWLLKNQLLKLKTAVIFKTNFSIFDIYCPVKFTM